MLWSGPGRADTSYVRLVKMAALGGGVALLAFSVLGLVGRRADHERATTLATAVAAARLDGELAVVATALTLVAFSDAENPVSGLSTALDRTVCFTNGSEINCEGPPVDVGSLALSNVEAWFDHAPPGTTVVAAPPGADGVGDGIVVATRQGAGILLAVVPTDGLSLVPADASPPAGAGSRHGAELVTPLSGEQWLVDDLRVGSSVVGSVVRASLPTGVVGAALVLGALAFLSQDLQTLRRRARFDALTQLPNRADFERAASAALTRAARCSSGACLVLIDLDDFKGVNDSVGHAAGDRALIDVAGRLRAAVRSTDLVARWGGDEFVALLAGVDDGPAVAERTVAITRAFEEEGCGAPTNGVVISASVGRALFPRDGADLTSLLAAADADLYCTKDLRLLTPRMSHATTGDASRRGGSVR